MGATMHIPDQRKEASVRTNFAPFVRTFTAKSKVLDIACGQGFILQMLKEADIEGVGIEFDDQLVEEACSAGLNVSQAEMFQYLQSTKDRLDGCIASHIVQHFPSPNVLELLQLINRVLLEVGKWIIITP
ncbi:MAG: methyltransferase domain-containing protein, partial [Deltaproteobacteria bacterium]|nr:methyltransferase domain-containing protein [Deltaproteobacteria bacterium]